MRVTSTMITNNMINQINASLTTLDKSYTQMVSQKKIQTPSEDPIIASRALKFRNIVSQTEQYSANVDQSTSWMEITESVFKNVNDVLFSLGELAEQGANGNYTVSDRKKMLSEYSSLVEQLEDEMNATYMGRYVFSGYRTDTPVIKKDGEGNNILNPAVYGGAEISITNADGTIDNSNIIYDKATSNVDITKNADGSANVNITQADGSTISAVANADNTSTITITKADGTVVTGTGTAVQNEDGSVTIKTTNADGSSTDMTAYTSVGSSVEGQHIKIEIGVGNYMNINSLATDVYPQEIYDDLHTFDNLFSEKFEAYENGTMSDSDKYAFEKDLQTTFNTMMGKINEIKDSVAEQHTVVGVKMNRLELTKARLTENDTNYTKLMTQNEGMDLSEATMRYSNANAAYQAALKVGMTITQLTLVDYL